jgi:hypothetical protein
MVIAALHIDGGASVPASRRFRELAKSVTESGRGQPHSNTLSRFSNASKSPQGFGVRLSSAAFWDLAWMIESSESVVFQCDYDL